VLSSDSGDAVIQPNHIFNPDEKGFTVCHTPGKNIAEKGKRSTGAITSCEKGKTITVLIIIIIIIIIIKQILAFVVIRTQEALGNVRECPKFGLLVISDRYQNRNLSVVCPCLFHA